MVFTNGNKIPTRATLETHLHDRRDAVKGCFFTGKREREHNCDFSVKLAVRTGSDSTAAVVFCEFLRNSWTVI